MFKQSFSQTFATPLIQAGICKRGPLPLARVTLLCTFLVVRSAGVLAQEPATSFDQLSLMLEKGDKITLVDPSGNKITGRVGQLAADGLDLKVSGKMQTFAAKDIRQITRVKADSPLNGFLIGVGIGFGATLPLNLGLASHDEKGMAVAASAIWGLIGGGIGAVVDGFIREKQLIYFRPKGNFSWNISPFTSDSASHSKRFGTPTSSADFPPYTRVKSSGLRITVHF